MNTVPISLTDLQSRPYYEILNRFLVQLRKAADAEGIIKGGTGSVLKATAPGFSAHQRQDIQTYLNFFGLMKVLQYGGPNTITRIDMEAPELTEADIERYLASKRTPKGASTTIQPAETVPAADTDLSPPISEPSDTTTVTLEELADILKTGENLEKALERLKEMETVNAELTTERDRETAGRQAVEVKLAEAEATLEDANTVRTNQAQEIRVLEAAYEVLQQQLLASQAAATAAQGELAAAKRQLTELPDPGPVVLERLRAINAKASDQLQ